VTLGLELGMRLVLEGVLGLELGGTLDMSLVELQGNIEVTLLVRYLGGLERDWHRHNLDLKKRRNSELDLG
jgi:hypothetical protein